MFAENQTPILMKPQERVALGTRDSIEERRFE
jgi:hypothetical protein